MDLDEERGRERELENTLFRDKSNRLLTSRSGAMLGQYYSYIFFTWMSYTL